MSLEILTKREKEILDLREVENLTFKQIGERIHVSTPRASELYRCATIARACPSSWDDNLSSRLRNVLNNYDFMSRESALEAVKSGRLHPHARRHIRNYGWACHLELCKALGLPTPRKSMKLTPPTVCPHCGLNTVAPYENPEAD